MEDLRLEVSGAECCREGGGGGGGGAVSAGTEVLGGPVVQWLGQNSGRCGAASLLGASFLAVGPQRLHGSCSSVLSPPAPRE